MTWVHWMVFTNMMCSEERFDAELSVFFFCINKNIVRKKCKETEQVKSRKYSGPKISFILNAISLKERKKSSQILAQFLA